jgi:hypothetical protein
MALLHRTHFNAFMAEMRIPLLRVHAGIPRNAAAAAAAGATAGTIAMALMQWMAIVVYDESLWKLPRMIAALVLGTAALAPDDDLDVAVVMTGYGVHYALSIAYGLALGRALREMPPAFAPLAGAAFGGTLYAINLRLLASVFPWFAELRTLDTVIAHALFGLVAAVAYRALTQAPEDGFIE